MNQENKKLQTTLLRIIFQKIAAFFENPKKVTEKDLGYYMLGVKVQKDVSGVVYE